MTKKDKDETAATKWDIRGVPAARAQVTPPSLAAVAQNPGVIDTRMLRSSFGEHAASYPDPAQWADIAVPFMASLSARHHGTPHSPGGDALATSSKELRLRRDVSRWLAQWALARCGNQLSGKWSERPLTLTAQPSFRFLRGQQRWHAIVDVADSIGGVCRDHAVAKPVLRVFFPQAGSPQPVIARVANFV